MAIDATTLRELKALDEASGGGLIEELVGLFTKGTPERIARCRAAIDAGDGHALADEAHALKGSAGAVGATVLLALAAELEKAGKAKKLEGALATLAAVEAEFRIAADELELEKARK